MLLEGQTSGFKMSLTILSFVVVLGVLIFFHEMGHFLVARLFNVGVEIFSLGFGPRIWGKKIGITDYRISAIPLGGFVKMVGDEPDAEIEPKDIPISFTHKSVYKRMAIVAAGPVFNLLLAVIIFYIILLVNGLSVTLPTVGSVEPDSPAAQAGIQKGDRILAINGRDVETWNNMALIISQSKGRSLDVSLKRGDSLKEIRLIPKKIADQNIFGEDTERFVIGIKSSDDVMIRKLGPVEALGQSLARTYEWLSLTVEGLWKIIMGTISRQNLGGPLMIAQLAGETARQGTANLAILIAILSIHLAFLNILPIPVLDGGHLLFFFIEALMGRPVSVRVREAAQRVGIFLLLLLMVYVFYNDINRFFINPA